jgi:hypothetical protein
VTATSIRDKVDAFNQLNAATGFLFRRVREVQLIRALGCIALGQRDQRLFDLALALQPVVQNIKINRRNAEKLAAYRSIISSP